PNNSRMACSFLPGYFHHCCSNARIDCSRSVNIPASSAATSSEESPEFCGSWSDTGVCRADDPAGDPVIDSAASIWLLTIPGRPLAAARVSVTRIAVPHTAAVQLDHIRPRRLMITSATGSGESATRDTTLLTG